MDDRKRKGIMEDGSNDSPRERARKATETRMRAAAPYVREDGNPGRNAPPPRVVNNQPPHGLPMGQQQPDAVVLGGSIARPGLEGQAAEGSGNRTPAPTTKVCPMCHKSSIFLDDAMCDHCAFEVAAKASVIHGPPPLPPRRQQQPHGLQRSSSPTYLEFIANRPIEQQQLRGPPVIQNPRPGLLPWPPQSSPVPRGDDVKQQPVLIVESRWHPIEPQQLQHPQPPPPVSAGTQQRRQQQLLRNMAELAAGIHPVGERSGAPGGLSDARIGLPVFHLQQPPQAPPEPSADMPVGRYYNPIVPGSAAFLDDGWCPACRHFPARKLLQPREHDCVCFTCLYVDGIVCPVCSSA